MSGSNRVQRIFLWGLPWSVLAATWLYWPVVQDTGFAFPLYLLAAPVLFAYVVIRLTTERLRLWCWTIPLAHLAFLWAVYPALGLLILGDTIAEPFTTAALIKTVVFSALVGAVLGTLVDIVGMDEELLKVHHTPQHLGTVKTVLSYSFQFFGIFGALYGASAKVGHLFLVERGATRWLPLLILGAAATLILPFMLHFLVLRKQRRLHLAPR